VTVPEQVGANVRRRRLALGISQMELGNRADMPLEQVSRIERGRKDVQLMTVLRLARGLGVPASALFAGIR
jgi:transcriptional regulator with XRE-family HTH domain